MHLDDIVFVPLNQEGKFAIIDREDAGSVMTHRWCIYRGRYANRRDYSRGGTTFMHQQVLDHPGSEIDHINRNGLDNRKANLRIVTRSENMRNRGPQRNNTSGYKGVTLDRARNAWAARIAVNGRHRHLGRFSTAQEAALAYDVAARELHGDFAYLNFPDMP